MLQGTARAGATDVTDREKTASVRPKLDGGSAPWHDTSDRRRVTRCDVVRSDVKGLSLFARRKHPGMTDQEFAELLGLGYESRGVEFKPPGPRSDSYLLAAVARAALGMANLRDGGIIVIGV